MDEDHNRARAHQLARFMARAVAGAMAAYERGDYGAQADCLAAACIYAQKAVECVAANTEKG